MRAFLVCIVLIVLCGTYMECKKAECYFNSKTWTGQVSHTVGGRTCQRWVLNLPHKHIRHADALFPDGSQKAAKNYCRDPDGKGEPWCFTTDASKRWEYCGIPKCQAKCYTNSKTWTGHVSHTVGGRTCQRWVSNLPHKHIRHANALYPDGSQKAAKNYCRDPDGKGEPWCFTTDASKRWEYCGIPKCHRL